MLTCTSCKTECVAGSRFCVGCGSPILPACSNCGAVVQLGYRFCAACGAPLNGLNSIGKAVAPTAEFKQATVLFADIVSSTRLVASMDAEQTMLLLAPLIAVMTEVASRFGGTIGRTLGDGVMALFGAPQAHEGHALLACQAAIELHAAASRFAGIQLRVGLHSGEVVIDPSVSAAHERQLHGVSIHLASRIVAMADAGATLMTGASFALVRTQYDAASLGARPAKGFDDPVEVYRLLGARSLTPIRSRPSARRQTSLRGRDAELALFREAIREVESGRRRIIGIAGAPGTGKSRLCSEIARWCQDHGIRLFRARSQLYGHATPLQPVLEFLRSQVFRIASSDDPSTARRRIAQRLRSLGGELVHEKGLFNEFLGVAELDVKPSSLNAISRRARLLEVVGKMFRQLATRTCVFIIEDLHWLDAASADFLAVLIDAVADTPTLLVLNYRQPFSTAWMSAPGFEQIVLSDLSETDMIGLVGELIGGRSEVQDLAIRVAKRSGGNPFFAEELVRGLTADGTLVGSENSFTLGDGLPGSTLPATVQAVIGARIDQLSEDHKALLQLCAIVGKDFPLGVLERVADLKREQLVHRLQELCSAEFLQVATAGIEDGYSFRHPLIQEGAYRMQLRQRRAPLHALVARSMESFYEDRGDEFAALIAHHYEAAGQMLNAARHAARAAAWLSATDTAQAIKQWRKVRQLMQDQPDSAEANVVRSRACTQIAWLGWREGLTVEQAKPLIDEALSWARQSEHHMIPLLLFLEGRIHVASGGAADYYVERVRQAFDLTSDADLGRRATLNAAMCHALGWAGLLREALACNDAVLEDVGAIDLFDQQVLGYSAEHWALGLRCRILIRMGRFEDAEAAIARVLAIEKRALDPTVRFIAHMGTLEIAMARGDSATAMEHAARVDAIAGEHPSAYLRVFACAARGTYAATLSDFDGAISYFQESLCLLRSTRAAMEYESELLASIAECHLNAWRLDEATKVANEAMAVARSQTTRLPQCRAHMILAATHGMNLEHSDREQAAAHLAQAEALITRTGAVIYFPRLQELQELLDGGLSG